MIINAKKTILRLIRMAIRMALILWAGFWTWFVVCHVITDGPGCLPYALRFCVPLAILTVIGWRCSRIGGVILAVAGIVAALYFQHNFLLVMPAIILGLLMILFGRKSL